MASRDYQCAFQQYKHVFDAGVARQSKELVLLCAKAAWHAGKLIYYEKVVTASVDEMMAFLLYAALYGSHVDAILLLSSVYYHGCNDVDVDMLKACAWLYEGVILCSSNECLIKLLHALIQLHSSDELKSAYWSDDGKLLFQLIDNTILTNIEFVNNLHEYIISTKYKDNCIESEYHVIYALLMQLSALITK